MAKHLWLISKAVNILNTVLFNCKLLLQVEVFRSIFIRNRRNKNLLPHTLPFAEGWDSKVFSAEEHKKTEALHLKYKLFCSLVLCELEAFVDCQLEGKKVNHIL